MNEVVQPDIQPLKLAGRCADGAERGKGVRVHAVPVSKRRALCGAAPGRMSAGWSSARCDAVTCPRCLAAIPSYRAVAAYIERQRTRSPS